MDCASKAMINDIKIRKCEQQKKNLHTHTLTLIHRKCLKNFIFLSLFNSNDEGPCSKNVKSLYNCIESIVYIFYVSVIIHFLQTVHQEKKIKKKKNEKNWMKNEQRRIYRHQPEKLTSFSL